MAVVQNNNGQQNGSQGGQKRQAVSMADLFAKVKMKNMLIVLGVITVLYIAFQIYFSLMVFAVDNVSLRISIIVLLLIWTIPFIVRYTLQYRQDMSHKVAIRHVHWGYMIPAALLVVTTLVSICLAIFTTPMFLASEYNQMIPVAEKSGQTAEDGTFDKYAEFKTEVGDFAQDEMKVAIIDKAFAMLLGEKVLGDTTGGYASQFTINNYTLINYKDSLYWVGAIEPKGFFQWTSSSKSGSPGYVLVDATQTGDSAKAELVTSHPLKYTPGAFFGQDAARKLYFGSMSSMRDGTMNFELDDDGVPYFTQAIYKKKFGITSGKDIVGVMTLNAETGEVKKYDIDKAPAWIDRIMPSTVITEQLNYWGEYKHGYFNTWFAKKEVNNTTDGYSYVYNNGKLYYTTGISAKSSSDRALIGTVLTDTRTKETVMYNMIGATENAAQSSAMGIPEVQAANLQATFPALVNFAGVPSYYIGLKDNAGNIKMYAYVSVEEYSTKLVAANSPEEAKEMYAKVLNVDTEKPVPPVAGEDKQIVIDSITSYVSGGNTMFYIVGVDGERYTANVNIEGGLDLLLAKAGNTVNCVVNNGVITKIVSII